MEEVLEVYTQPYDPFRPQVCRDEGSVQFVSEKRETLEMEPGKVKRVDYEEEREGFGSIFLGCEPLTGKIVTKVKERRTKEECAQFLKQLVEEVSPEAEHLVVVMDHLKTPPPGSF